MVRKTYVMKAKKNKINKVLHHHYTNYVKHQDMYRQADECGRETLK